MMTARRPSPTLRLPDSMWERHVLVYSVHDHSMSLQVIEPTESHEEKDLGYLRSRGRYSKAIPILDTPKRVNNKTTLTDSICRGHLNGVPEDVFVDSQAQNFISESYLKSNRIPWDPGSTHAIRVADGHEYKTLGQVSLPWTFSGDNKKYEVSFSVLPNNLCHYAVIFGGTFMRSIKVFKSWKRWILNVPRKSDRPRVRFQGSGQLRIDGMCDGLHVSASPDCASDIPLVSSTFAKRLNKPIDTSQDCCIDLELPGDRIVKTVGMIRNVNWSFGDQSYLIDFYVLEGLPTEILLDREFLEVANVFEDFNELLHEIEEAKTGRHDGLFLLVRRMLKTESQGPANRFSERLSALLGRRAPSPPENEALRDFYSREKLLIDQQRSINKSNMSADEKKAETERIQDRMKLLQQSRPLNGNTGTASNSQSQSGSSGAGSTEGSST